MIPLLWVDLETTGLDEEDGIVLEIAARLTDPSLNEVSRFHTVIHYPDDAFDLVNLDAAVRDMHTRNGLLAEVAASDVDLYVVRERFANWLFENFKLGEKRPLAGSNPNFDRRWLKAHFEEATTFLHYRSFDMNSVYYFMEIEKDKTKKGIHRANADLDWDINMLRQLVARTR